MSAPPSRRRSAGSRRDPIVLGELGGGDLISSPTSGATDQVTVSLKNIQVGEIGYGTYETGSGEIGVSISASPFPLSGLSLGIGSALNRFNVSAGISFQSGLVSGIGLTPTGQVSAGIGMDSSGLYFNQTSARGISASLGPVVGASSLVGTQTSTFVHPEEALLNTFTSVVGPLADPTTFIDPFVDTGPYLNQKP